MRVQRTRPSRVGSIAGVSLALPKVEAKGEMDDRWPIRHGRDKESERPLIPDG